MRRNLTIAERDRRDARIAALRVQGHTILGISKLVDCAPPTVRSALERMERPSPDCPPDGPQVGALVVVRQVSERRTIVDRGLLVYRTVWGCRVKSQRDGRERPYALLRVLVEAAE